MAGRDHYEGAPPSSAGSHRGDGVHDVRALLRLHDAPRDGRTLDLRTDRTTRGPATAPIWEFTLQGTDVKVTRVAIANPVVVAPQVDEDPNLGLAVDAASGSVGRNELTVAFVGAPDPGNLPCGEDYTAEAVEPDLAVVVIVTRHPHSPPFGGACSAVGARRTATATLAARSATGLCSTCSREPRSRSRWCPRALHDEMMRSSQRHGLDRRFSVSL